jgi:hypothetical protein
MQMRICVSRKQKYTIPGIAAVLALLKFFAPFRRSLRSPLLIAALRHAARNAQTDELGPNQRNF